MSPKRPKRNHKVPQFYLNKFAAPGKKDSFRIVDVNKKNGKVLPNQDVSNVAFENDFTTLASYPENPSAYEEHLSRQEGYLSGMYKSKPFGGDESYRWEHRLQLAKFMVLQWLRAGRAQEMIFRNLKAALDESISNAEARGLTVPAEIRDAYGHLSTTYRADFHADVIEEQIERVALMLMGKPMTHFDFTDLGTPLITSDEPVTVGGKSGFGFLNSPAVFLPLSRFIGVVFFPIQPGMDVLEVWKGGYDKRRDGSMPEEDRTTEDLALLFNRATVDNAEERVYCHPDDEHIARKLVGELRPCQLVPDLP